MSSEHKIPIPCVACIIKNNAGQFLVSVRKGDGLYQFPGGKIEYGETMEAAIRREVLEETSIKLKNIRFFDIVDSILEEGDHYIVAFYIADSWEGTPENTEPEKCMGWNWMFPWLITQYKTLNSITELRKKHWNMFVCVE